MDEALFWVELLSVTTYGFGCGQRIGHFVGYTIAKAEASPMLEDLPLDGSREPDYEDRKRLDYEWAPKDTTAWKALRLFASRCRSVRRLAVTEAYLSRNVEMMRAGHRFQCWSALRCMEYLML